MTVSVNKEVMRSFHLQGLPHWSPNVDHMTSLDDSFRQPAEEVLHTHLLAWAQGRSGWG